MLIRTYADITKLKGKAALSPAERTLIDNCTLGEPTVLGDGTRPEGPSPERTIRADLLRYLILGGCEQCRVHERGVQLVGAWIEGELDLSFATAKGLVHLFRCAFDTSLMARQAHLDGLILSGSSLPALDASGFTVRGSVFLDKLKGTGEISLSGAEIGGQLSGNGAVLNGEDGQVLTAQGAIIRGGVFLDNIMSVGEVSFSGAQIDGQLSCEGAEMSGGRGFALNAQGVSITGGVFLRKLKSTGEVSFSGAKIDVQLVVNDAGLNGVVGNALSAQRAKIRGGAFLNNVKSIGEVSFSGAEIDGQLSVEGAELNGGGRKALNAQGAKIMGNLTLKRLKSTGEVSLSGAEIGGQLSFVGAALNGGKGMAMNAQRIVVSGGLIWRQINSIVGQVGLSAAHLGDLVDDEQSWNAVPSLRLLGATYDNLVGPLDLSFRKRWLVEGAKLRGQFHPQPYQQLAKFYRETGHRHEAREILIEKEKEQRKAVRSSIANGRGKEDSALHPYVRILGNWLWDWATRLVAGYGYKPWLALGWLTGMVATVAVLANLTWNAGDFAPNSAVVLTSPDWKAIADGPSANPAADWSATLAPGKDFETFFSLAYALDVVVPVLDLGQTDAWAPSPARGGWGTWMFYLQKLFIVLGWVVTAIAAAAISGMIRRDD